MKTRLDVRLVDFDFIAGAKHLLHGAPLLTRADIAARVRTEVHLLQRYLPPFEEVGLIKALATRYFKRQLDYCDDLCRELSEPMSRCADFSLAALADVLDLADIAS